MSAEAVAKLLMLLGRLGKTDEDPLKTVCIVLASVLGGVCLLLALAVYILTSPFELEGLEAFQAAFSGLIAQDTNIDAGALTDADIAAITGGIDDPQRQAVVSAALSLVGRVPYFWGGKSGPGWNEKWNTPVLVTAPGSSTSGTYQPYGMDCTGFVHWVFWTALGTDSLAPAAANSLWYGSRPIREDELLPGDIVYKDPPTVPVNHVGVYLGRDADGNNIYIHCSYGGGGVVMNSYDGFKYWRRPPVLEGE